MLLLSKLNGGAKPGADGKFSRDQILKALRRIELSEKRKGIAAIAFLLTLWPTIGVSYFTAIQSNEIVPIQVKIIASVCLSMVLSLLLTVLLAKVLFRVNHRKILFKQCPEAVEVYYSTKLGKKEARQRKRSEELEAKAAMRKTEKAAEKKEKAKRKQDKVFASLMATNDKNN